MKAVVFGILLFGCSAIPANARIGDTFEQCSARYGETTKRAANGMIFFEKSGFVVGVTFFDGRVDAIAFFKKEADELGHHAAISDNEVELLLKANGGEQPWKKVAVISMDRTWATVDGSLTATCETFNPTLVIMTKAAALRADEAKKHAEQKKLDGF